MEINKSKSERFDYYKEEHIKDGGESPDAYAITKLIQDSVINKDYIRYHGGGPYICGTEVMFLKKFDVVVTFNFAGDPDFGVIVDEDMDSCTIYSSDTTGQLMGKVI